MSHHPILLADPRASYLALRTAIDAAMRNVLEGPTYILGAPVSDFEAEFARYVGVGHGIGVNNGTDALHLALRALGVGAEHEVITVSHTAVATVAAIRMCGAQPVLVDVDPATRTMDPEAVRAMIGERTKAIVAVHLYGHPADLDALAAICSEYGLDLVEDCAQAHGATHRGRKVGSIGRVSAFSFYPTKNLGALGDGGMVLTDDPALAARVKLLRQYGWETPQNSLVEGWNSRLDPLQAAVLSVKLKHLDAHTQRRRELAKGYRVALAHLPLVLPLEANDRTHVYHLYVVELKDRIQRDALRAHLLTMGIHAGIHYPHPVHLQPAYQGVLRVGAMACTERLADTVLSLPLFPELTGPEQDRVCAGVIAFFNQRA